MQDLSELYDIACDEALSNLERRLASERIPFTMKVLRRVAYEGEDEVGAAAGMSAKRG